MFAEAGPTDHWSTVWTARAADEVSWFQPAPDRSVELVQRFAPDRTVRILDVGGGPSLLVDHLLDLGYADVTVVDIAEAALEQARARLGARAAQATWTVGDAISLEVLAPIDLWHDRATFHFLTDPVDRQAYGSRLRDALRPGGHAIVATYAPDGPDHCADLPVMRYDGGGIATELDLELVEAGTELHVTPDGQEQPFVYTVLRRWT